MRAVPATNDPEPPESRSWLTRGHSAQVGEASAQRMPRDRVVVTVGPHVLVLSNRQVLDLARVLAQMCVQESW